MESRVFGNKDIFAIERKINKREPYLMGNMCLWIGGLQVGSFEDEVMLSCIQQSLSCFSSRFEEMEEHDFRGKPSEEIFFMVFESDMDNGQFLIHIAESFDDFELFTYKEDNEIHFVWKLVDAPFFKYPNYPEGIMHKKVDVNFLLDVINSDGIWS